MNTHLLHDRKCEHCHMLMLDGECCYGVWCSCRNVYREGVRNEIARGILADYYWRRGKLNEARRVAPDYRPRRSD